jgi:hypothetical protein
MSKNPEERFFDNSHEFYATSGGLLDFVGCPLVTIYRRTGARGLERQLLELLRRKKKKKRQKMLSS